MAGLEYFENLLQLCADKATRFTIFVSLSRQLASQRAHNSAPFPAIIITVLPARLCRFPSRFIPMQRRTRKPCAAADKAHCQVKQNVFTESMSPAGVKSFTFVQDRLKGRYNPGKDQRRLLCRLRWLYPVMLLG